jgi:peptide-methionine (S)-S-oxide reductase
VGARERRLSLGRSEEDDLIQDGEKTMSDGKQFEVATLGGGCFWCLEAVFERVEGVLAVHSGYAGGGRSNPTYEQVCSGATGHAEVVQVRFDPSVIGYREILEIFFAMHDPTTLDRQGADVGTQYRSIVFHENEEQREAARSVIRQLEEEGIFDAPIVTEVEPLEAFWPAEEYHHEYFRRNPTQPYCQLVVAPKVAKLRQRFAHRLRADG